MPFLAVQKWWSANVISDTKHVFSKICKVRKGFTVLREQIIVNAKRTEMSQTFWAKLYCKIRDR